MKGHTMDSQIKAAKAGGLFLLGIGAIVVPLWNSTTASDEGIRDALRLTVGKELLAANGRVQYDVVFCKVDEQAASEAGTIIHRVDALKIAPADCRMKGEFHHPGMGLSTWFAYRMDDANRDKGAPSKVWALRDALAQRDREAMADKAFNRSTPPRYYYFEVNEGALREQVQLIAATARLAETDDEEPIFSREPVIHTVDDLNPLRGRGLREIAIQSDGVARRLGLSAEGPHEVFVEAVRQHQATFVTVPVLQVKLRTTSASLVLAILALGQLLAITNALSDALGSIESRSESWMVLGPISGRWDWVSRRSAWLSTLTYSIALLIPVSVSTIACLIALRADLGWTVPLAAGILVLASIPPTVSAFRKLAELSPLIGGRR